MVIIDERASLRAVKHLREGERREPAHDSRGGKRKSQDSIKSQISEHTLIETSTSRGL